MGVRPPQKPTPPKKPTPHPQIPAPHLQFILSLSKDELGVPPKKNHPPNPKIPPSTPLTTPKLMFYNNPNAKTSFPRTAQNGGSYGVKSRPG